MAVKEIFEEKGKLWVVLGNGHIICKKGNYSTEKFPAESCPMPAYPEVKEEELITYTFGDEVIFRDTADKKITNYWKEMEAAEKKYDVAEKEWRENRKKGLKKVKLSYRKQQTRSFIRNLFRVRTR